jgi:hypothetical protein
LAVKAPARSQPVRRWTGRDRCSGIAWYTATAVVAAKISTQMVKA